MKNLTYTFISLVCIAMALTSTGCSHASLEATEQRIVAVAQPDKHVQVISKRQQRTEQQEQIFAENARLIEELRQRGIDVRDSERGVVVNLPDVLFETGKAKLTGPAQEIVLEIAQVIQRAPSRHLLVEGHTDSVGTIEYNYRLSESRSQEVANALEANGIPRRMIATRALGETTPIASNRTEQGRRRNRRVEVIIENVGG